MHATNMIGSIQENMQVTWLYLSDNLSLSYMVTVEPMYANSFCV